MYVTAIRFILGCQAICRLQNGAWSASESALGWTEPNCFLKKKKKNPLLMRLERKLDFFYLAALKIKWYEKRWDSCILQEHSLLPKSKLYPACSFYLMLWQKPLKQRLWIISSNWVINSGRTRCSWVLCFFHYAQLLLGKISLERIGSNQVTKKVNLNKCMCGCVCWGGGIVDFANSPDRQNICHLSCS